MKKQLTSLVSIIIVLNCFSQTTFEKGYFINNSNQKIDCLIKNKDWESNPSRIEYKLSENSDPQTLTTESVKEFKIADIAKYERHTVQIDRSSEYTIELSNTKNPVFSEENLFLKILIEGKANLYIYNDAGLIRYFFKTENSDVEQLVCKSYLISENQIGKNNLFRQQLLERLRCNTMSIMQFQNLNYNRKDLINLFVNYNECIQSDYVNYNNKQTSNTFHLTVKPGIKSSSLSVTNDEVYYGNIKFKSEVDYKFGLEAEFILPFNNNKWAVVVEPTYQYFKSTETHIAIVTIGRMVTSDVIYKSLELPIGIRYYVFLNEKSRLFADVLPVYDFSFDSSIDITRDDGDFLQHLDINTRINLFLGLGYKYNDRYSIAFRYGSSRDIISNYIMWESSYRTFSLVLGYTIF